MSDCVTVSDATILYCSDIECTENTCYADPESTFYVAVGAVTPQLDSTLAAGSHHEYDVPRLARAMNNNYI